MKAMLYLFRKEIKNSLLDILRHPGKLILYLFIIALLGFSLLTGTDTKKSVGVLDFRILEGLYLGVSILLGLPMLLSGLKSGATFFRMSDVNFLFVSPISPKKILAYGLIKQMGTSLLMMFFLLFYSGMAYQLFGVMPHQLVALIAGFALLLFTMQVLALLFYSYSSGNPSRVQGVKTVLYVLLGLTAAFIMFTYFANGARIESLLAAISSPYLTILPVVGWIKGMVFAIMKGNGSEILIYAALNAAALIGGILLFIKSNSDYYEDVLQTTETAFELRQSMKEGRSFQRKMNSGNVKIRDTGINHGWGANTFFFKHIRQNSRMSRLPFLGASTVVMTVLNLVLAIFFRTMVAANSDKIPVGVIMGICLAASSYILFFFNLSGDWSKELIKPYIYLVPENPFSKLVWACLSTVLKPAMDGVLIFTVLAIYLKANPATALLCMLAYASVGFLYVSVNILFQRLFGTIMNKGLIMLVYMLLLGLLFAPGAVVSGLLYAFADYLPGFVIGLPCVVWNFAVSLGIFAACRNLLSSVDFNN